MWVIEVRKSEEKKGNSKGKLGGGKGIKGGSWGSSLVCLCSV